MKNDELDSLNDFFGTDKPIDFPRIREVLEQTIKSFNAFDISLNIPKYLGNSNKDFSEIFEDLICSSNDFSESADFLTKNKMMAMAGTLASLANEGIVQHGRGLTELVEHCINHNISISNNISLTTRLKITDMEITLREGFKKFSNYSKTLEGAPNLPFSKLYKTIFDDFYEILFPKGLKDLKPFNFSSRRPRNNHPTGNAARTASQMRESIKQQRAARTKKSLLFTNYEEVDEEDAEIVDAELLETGTKIIQYINITNVYVNENYTASSPEEVETKTAWNSFLKPCLGIMGSVFLTWAMCTDSLADMNITHTLRDVIQEVKQHPVEQSKIKAELKGPNTLKEVDKYKLNNTST
ncbi:hypothetical protein [Priestia megaterium]